MISIEFNEERGEFFSPAPHYFIKFYKLNHGGNKYGE